MRQPATWTPTHDAALSDLLRAWHRLDDLRYSTDFVARADALLELQHARGLMRDVTRPQRLAA